MRKENIKSIQPVETNESEELLSAIVSELASSEDFILTYIKTLCIVNGGKFNLDELRDRYGWRLAKVQALSSAINHFAARGLVKRGATTNDCSLA